MTKKYLALFGIFLIASLWMIPATALANETISCL